MNTEVVFAKTNNVVINTFLHVFTHIHDYIFYIKSYKWNYRSKSTSMFNCVYLKYTKIQRGYANLYFQQCVRAVLYEVSYTYKSPGDLINRQILI